MSQPPDLKPIAQALADAARLPGVPTKDVDQCESSRLKFVCYAIAARLHEDPGPLLAALGLGDIIEGVLLDHGVATLDELARLADDARKAADAADIKTPMMPDARERIADGTAPKAAVDESLIVPRKAAEG